MADKSIRQLNPFPPGASIDSNNTLLVAEYSDAAYKLDGHTLILALADLLDGHGGINSITYAPPVSPSLVGTMTITLADETEVEVEINNGKGISSVTKTSTSELVDTYTITYNDGTTSTFTVTNGEKGDTGDSWYMYIRYASQQPTQDSDISTIPDKWIGIYSGTSATAPTHYTDYTWYEFKGAQGNPGTPATLQAAVTEYQQGSSGTIAPSGTWTETVPTVTAGNYLWTRTTITFTGESPIVYYSVGRMGIDGAGAVSKVNNISPDSQGNVALTADDIPTDDNTSIQSRIDGAESRLDTAEGDISTLDGRMDTAESDITALDNRLDTAESDITSLETAVSGKANASVARSVTIAVADWANKACTKSVSGVTTDNNFGVSPAPASFLAYGEAQIRATAQGNGTVSFACETVPTVAISVNVIIWG